MKKPQDILYLCKEKHRPEPPALLKTGYNNYNKSRDMNTQDVPSFRFSQSYKHKKD